MENQTEKTKRKNKQQQKEKKTRMFHRKIDGKPEKFVLNKWCVKSTDNRKKINHEWEEKRSNRESTVPIRHTWATFPCQYQCSVKSLTSILLTFYVYQLSRDSIPRRWNNTQRDYVCIHALRFPASATFPLISFANFLPATMLHTTRFQRWSDTNESIARYMCVYPLFRCARTQAFLILTLVLHLTRVSGDFP